MESITENKHKCKCLNPRTAWICGTTYCKADGVLSPRIVFNAREALHYFYGCILDSLLQPQCGRDKLARYMMDENAIEMPCGKCASCMITKRKDMSVRLAHEASQFENCCFITLTYSEENLPCTNPEKFKSSASEVVRGIDFNHDLPTLLPRDVQLFMKRLRRHLEYQPKRQKGVRDHIEHIRYFAVGEYGTKSHRPHYHILIFGWKPSDGKLLFLKDGRPVFRSAQIEKCWTLGISSFSNVTPYVAKYCARYVTKKYARLDGAKTDWDKYIETCIVPEFTLQSVRNGGIGATWFDKFGAAACKVGLCCVRMGERIAKCTIPKYYWNRLRKVNLPLWLECRDERIEFVKHHKSLGYYVSRLQREAACVAEADRYFATKEVF